MPHKNTEARRKYQSSRNGTRGEYRKQYYSKNRDRIIRETSLYYHKNKALVSKQGRARRYGITVKDVERIISKGVCEICLIKLELLRDMYFDHDHNTGKVRGLLCHKCNTGLGCFSDSPDKLQAALDYLATRRVS